MNTDVLQLKVKPSTSVPLYLQVKRFLQKEIEEGRFKMGNRLPSIRQLAKGNLLSATTIERAYWELEKETWIIKEKGRGYFVSESKVNQMV